MFTFDLRLALVMTLSRYGALEIVCVLLLLLLLLLLRQFPVCRKLQKRKKQSRKNSYKCKTTIL